MGVKVTNIPGAYAFEGKSYGPFSATNKKEFVEVPADLAASMNLPLHESELSQAQDEIQPDGADIQELLDANSSLKVDLDKAGTLILGLRGELDSLHKAAAGQGDELQAVRAMLDSTHEGAAQLGAARNALQTELESTQSDFIRYQNDLPGLKARVAELEAGLTTEQPPVTTEPVTAEPEAQADPHAKPAHAPKKVSKP